jgi:4-hydroxybenzoate polyprenyltransferase
MKGFLQFIKLTRPLNLLIIALTMGLMRYYVIRPLVEVNGFQLQFPMWKFLLLILSTLLIAAAGNVINDYFDQRTDRINKPKDIIVGVHVKRRVAMMVHQLFNALGLGIAVYLAWSIGMWKLSILSFFAAGSLWFYSVQFKKDLIIGNVIIALLAGMVPLLVGVYEIPLIMQVYGAEVAQYFAIELPGEDPTEYFKIMFYFILGYSAFAFGFNLIREIQKDMADVKGDMRIGAQTIPLVYGLKKAKYIVGLLIAFSIGLLLAVQQSVLDDNVTLVYMLITVVLPLLISLWLNHRAVRRKEFVRAGAFLKIAMLGGILYSIVHYYIYFANAIG